MGAYDGDDCTVQVENWVKGDKEFKTWNIVYANTNTQHFKSFQDHLPDSVSQIVLLSSAIAQNNAAAAKET